MLLHACLWPFWHLGRISFFHTVKGLEFWVEGIGFNKFFRAPPGKDFTASFSMAFMACRQEASCSEVWAKQFSRNSEKSFFSCVRVYGCRIYGLSLGF